MVHFLPYPAVNIQVIVQVVRPSSNPVSSFVDDQTHSCIWAVVGGICHRPPLCKLWYWVRSTLNVSARSPTSASFCTVGGLDVEISLGDGVERLGMHLRVLYASFFERRWFILHNHGRKPLLSDSSFRFFCNSSTTERWQTRTFESCSLFVSFNLGYLKRHPVTSLLVFRIEGSVPYIDKSDIFSSISSSFRVDESGSQLAKDFQTSRPKRWMWVACEDPIHPQHVYQVAERLIPRTRQNRAVRRRLHPELVQYSRELKRRGRYKVARQHDEIAIDSVGESSKD
jgi:hypothetical protein